MKHESKKASRLYEAEKFQSLTNICGIKVLETLYLFVLQISKIFWPTSRSDQSEDLKLGGRGISAFLPGANSQGGSGGKGSESNGGEEDGYSKMLA